MCDICEKLKTRNQMLEADMINMTRMMREKNKQISLLKRKIKRLELKVPKSINETQLSIYDILVGYK